MGCLYQLTAPNGKKYIGITNKTAQVRWAKHVEHAIGKRDAGALYSALRKHGVDAFDVKTLVIAKDWEYLRELERRAIIHFDTVSPHGYNMTAGGEGNPGTVFSEKARANIAVAQKKRFADPEQRKKLKEFGAISGEIISKRHAALRVNGKAPWQVRKLESTLKAQLSPEEFKKLRSQRIKSAMRNPEVALKVKACAKVRSESLEWRNKISISKTGTKMPPATEQGRKNHSEGAKRMWARRKANG